MNYQNMVKLATEFCLECKHTIAHVRESLLPELESELQITNECARQYADAGLENYLADTQKELAETIEKCKQRLSLAS